MHTLPWLLSTFFCLQRSQREARAAASNAQCKGEAPLNPTIILNTQSERGSTDPSTDKPLVRDPSSQATRGAANQPQTLQSTQLTPNLCRAETSLLFSLGINSTSGSVLLSPSCQSLLLYRFLSSPSLPECN